MVHFIGLLIVAQIGGKFFTCMRSHVDDQLTGLNERFPTDTALVRSFARMNAHVTVQLAAMLEGTAAHVTLVGSLFGVDSPMNLQILLDTEHLVTELTLERTLPCVCTIMAHLKLRHNLLSVRD